MSSELRDNRNKVVSESTRKWNDGKTVMRRFMDFGNGRRMLVENGGKKLGKAPSDNQYTSGRSTFKDFMQSNDDFATL